MVEEDNKVDHMFADTLKEYGIKEVKWQEFGEVVQTEQIGWGRSRRGGEHCYQLTEHSEFAEIFKGEKWTDR